MVWCPHVTVAAVIERDGRFLLVEEETPDGILFNQPAGHLDEGESIITAAIRETLEETAWRVKIDSWLGLYTYTAPANSVTYLRVAFVANLVENMNTQLDEGIQAAVWMDYETLLLKEAAGELRSPLVKQVIDDYRSGRRLPLSSIYEH